MTNPTLQGQSVRLSHQPRSGVRHPDRQNNQFQQLLDQLRMLGYGRHGLLRTVGVTSSRRREGVTTVACNLALHAASFEGLRTLLIDANYSNPRLQRVFQIPRAPGLMDLLQGTAEESECFQDLSSRSPKSWAAAFKSSYRRRRGIFRYLTQSRHSAQPLPLTVVPIGSETTDAGTMLDAATTGMLSHAAADFDLVIVDLPESTAATSGGFLRALDGVLLVLEAESTSDTVAQRALTRLNQNEVNVMGVVFNKYRSHLPRWIDRKLRG